MSIIPKRLFFEKRDRIKYTSHLDTMRAFTRALGRSDLPLWYTEGFNPHLYLTFALPLALGCEGLRESVDIRLTAPVADAEIIANINEGMPPGLRIIGIGEPIDSPTAITWADYHIELILPGQESELFDKLDSFSKKKEIAVMKKTKKGQKTVDIAPLCELLSSERIDDGLAIELRLASGSELNIGSALWLEAFFTDSGLGEALARVTRTSILKGDFTPFN